MAPPDDTVGPQVSPNEFVLFALIFAVLLLLHAPLLSLPYFWDEAGYFVPAARDLLLMRPLVDLIEHLLIEPIAGDFGGTSLRPISRRWHRRDDLDPRPAADHAVHIFVLLEDSQAHGASIEVVTGAHRWPIVAATNILPAIAYDDLSDPQWMDDAERVAVPAMEHH